MKTAMMSAHMKAEKMPHALPSACPVHLHVEVMAPALLAHALATLLQTFPEVDSVKVVPLCAGVVNGTGVPSSSGPDSLVLSSGMRPLSGGDGDKAPLPQPKTLSLVYGPDAASQGRGGPACRRQAVAPGTAAVSILLRAGSAEADASASAEPGGTHLWIERRRRGEVQSRAGSRFESMAARIPVTLSCTPDALRASLYKVAYQNGPFDHSVPRVSPPRWGRLSERQREVADLAASGLSNQEIADPLFIDISTVKSHLSAVYRVLGIRRRTQIRERRWGRIYESGE